MISASEKKAQRKEFGKRLIEAREARGLSQIDVAEAVGVTRAAISLYERGESGIETEKVKAIADFLDVKVSWLQWNIGEKPNLKTAKTMRRALRPVNGLGGSAMAWSNRIDKPPFHDAIAEMEADIGLGTALDLTRVRDWWKLPPSVLEELKVSEGKHLRFHRVGRLHGFHAGSLVLVNVHKPTPFDGEVFAINDEGTGLVLRRLVFQVGRPSEIGLASADGESVQLRKLSAVKLYGRVIGKFTNLLS